MSQPELESFIQFSNEVTIITHIIYPSFPFTLFPYLETYHPFLDFLEQRQMVDSTGREKGGDGSSSRKGRWKKSLS